MFLLKGTRAFQIIVLLAACMGALTSCERRSTSLPEPVPINDPRILKTYGEAGNWFCTVEIEYSEGSETPTTVRKLLVSTAEKRSLMTTQLSSSCASETGPGKILCSQKLQDKTYSCVHESLFIRNAAKKGNWQCRMEYQAVEPETEASLLLVTGKAGESAQATISAAFAECAEVDACARAMIERKMVCTNLLAAPVASPRPPQSVRIFR